MMKRIAFLIAVALTGTLFKAHAQTNFEMGADFFDPIAKYVQAGDCEKLAAWFADDLELDILGAVNSCTRNQAKRIMKNFFNNYTPKQFAIIHKSGKAPIKYAVGTLDAGGEKFRMILYVKMNESPGSIQQLKIERQ